MRYITFRYLGYHRSYSQFCKVSCKKTSFSGRHCTSLRYQDLRWFGTMGGDSLVFTQARFITILGTAKSLVLGTGKPQIVSETSSSNLLFQEQQNPLFLVQGNHTATSGLAFVALSSPALAKDLKDFQHIPMDRVPYSFSDLRTPRPPPIRR